MLALNTMQMNVRDLFKNPDYIILFILAGLSFSIAFGLSSPSLLVNDEWITVNQLNQLATGSQLIENQGKFGKTIFGEESAYFTSRGNYLAYSIFLPVLSLPALYLIIGSGELFRLVFLTLWFCCSICALLACIWLIGKSDKKLPIHILWITVFLFLGLFLANLYFYQPFPASFQDSPIESAAVIFTNEVLFALMAPMIYSLFRNLSLDRRTAIIGTLSVICCSTYFFWSASAKDHLLIAFVLTTIFWIFSNILTKPTNLKWFALFIISGLLCWARPEYGVIVLAGLLIWKFLSRLSFQNGSVRVNFDKWIPQLLSDILGIFLGLIPFFLNNFTVTGNPLIPPQYLYITSSRTAMTSVLTSGNDVMQIGIGSKVITYISQIFSFFTPDGGNILQDISGLLLSPANGGVGIIFICPIILPALLYGLINHRKIKDLYTPNIMRMILFSAFIALFTFIAYMRVLHGSTISGGSLPDMRYFSPLYLPLGIISVLLLSPVICHQAERWLKYLLVSVLLFAPLLVIGTTLILPYGITYDMYGYFFMRILIVLLILIFGIAALSKKFWNSEKAFPLLFGLLIMIPTAFQFFYVVIYSYNKTNGYYFWQPVLQYLFTYVITIIN